MEKWFQNLPWYVRWPAAVVGTMTATFASKLPDWIEPFAIVAGVALAGWVVLASAWHWYNDRREKHGKHRVSIEPSHLFVIFLAATLVVAVWGLFFHKPAVVALPAPAPAAPFIQQAATKGPQYVTDHAVNMQYVSERKPDVAILYSAKFLETGNRIRVFLDIKADIRDFPERLLIAEAKDFVRGQGLAVLVAKRYVDEAQTWIFKWGAREDSPDFFGRYFARIALIGDSNQEQHYYFIVVPTIVNGQRYVDVINSEELSFFSRWTD